MKSSDFGRRNSAVRAMLLAGACLAASPALAQNAAPGGTSDPASATTAPAGDTLPPAGANQAAVDNGGIADIVVTAQRREEKLQNVPIAITAITGDSLKAQGVTNSMDLTQVVPGLNMTKAIGIDQLPFIRGVGTTQQGLGIETPVATYIDGVYIYDQASAALNLSDIDQVAVLKGPQGTLFGRNATGGVIQYTTRQPSFTTHAQGEVSYGNLEQFGANAYATTGLTNTVAVSLTAGYSGQELGFGRNLGTGKYVYTHHGEQFRGKLLWQPDDKTSVTLSGDYSNFNGAVPVNRIAGDRTVLGVPMPGTKWDTDLNYQPYVRVKGGGGSLTVKRDLGGPQFVSISAYRTVNTANGFDADGTPYALQQNHGWGYDHNWSEELQLVSPSTGRLTWVVGAFTMGEKNDGTSDNCGTYFPAGTTRPCTNSWSRSNGSLWTVAGFGQATFKINDSTNLTGGLRYSYDKRKAEKWNFSGAGTDAGPVGSQVVAAHPDDIHFSDPTYRISLDHRFSPALLVYASYNRGFRSGQFGNLGSTTPPVPATPVKPETLDAFEAGFKSDLLDNHLRINMSGYYYIDHGHVSFQIINGSSIALQAKKATLYGMDADATWRFNQALTFTLGVALEHSRYNSFGDASCAGSATTGVYLSNCGIGVTRNPNAAALLPQSNYILSFANDSGHQVESTPTFTLTAAPSYVLPTSVGEFRGTATFYHNSGWFSSPSNYARQHAYNTLSAEVLFTPAGHDNIGIRLYGANLTNAYYAEQYTETAPGPNFQVASGRTYGVALQLRY